MTGSYSGISSPKLVAPEYSDTTGTMRLPGEDVSEMINYVPERYKVIRHVRPKLSCPQCQKIVQTPAPERLIELSPLNAPCSRADAPYSARSQRTAVEMKKPTDRP